MRERFNAFVERHEVAWELAMAFFALVFVSIGFAIDQAEPATRPALQALEMGLTVLFLVEFAARLGAARDRPAYLRGHWIDLVALVPPLRGARWLRLLRLLRLIRALASVYRAMSRVEEVIRYRGFAALVTGWFTVMILSSFALYVAEQGVNQAIDSPFDALWWGVTTLTTVGYGDIVPTTPQGRLAAAVLMLLGISLFSAITATITSYLLDSRREARPPAEDAGSREPAPELVDDLERLTRLRDEGALTAREFERAKARLLG